MTTDDLPKGLPAARRSPLRSVSRSLFCITALCLTSVCAQAKTAAASITPEPIAKPALALISDVVVSDAKSETVAATAKPARNSVREKAAEAAAATLTALLPRLAASDSMPMLDRSAMFAGDLSRLLANYDLSQSGVIMQAGMQAESGGKVQAVE